MRIPKFAFQVSCVGYPHGDHASVTKGVVSRCTLQKFLSVQVDAAINAGNSGGPIFDKNAKCVGVARAHRRNSQLMCYIIPIEVVRVFIESAKRAALLSSEQKSDVSRGHIGMPSFGIGYQKLENDDLRKHLGLSEDDEGCGILLTKVLPLSPSDGVLKKGDVILAIDGVSVGSDGTAALRDAERINFMYLVRRHPEGTPVAVTFSRVIGSQGGSALRNRGSCERSDTSGNLLGTVQREVRTVSITVRDVLHKIPVESGANCHGQSWVVVGGAVFLHLTHPLLSKLKVALPTSCTDDMRYFVENTREETIILGHVLTDDVNFGYHGWSGLIVDEICSVRPKNLAHFASVIEGLGSDGIADISFVDGRRMLLNMAKVKDAEEAIAKRHSIPSSMSPSVVEGLKEFQ